MRIGPRAVRVGFLLVACLSCAGDEKVTGPRHVAIIVIDTLRADRLGLYGHDRRTSPRIDALGANGVVFEHSYSTASSTFESMVSVFTGTAALAHPDDLPEGLVPLQVLFRDAGFETHAVVSNPWLAKEPEFFKRGFDHYWHLAEWGGATINTTRTVAARAIARIEAHARTDRRGFFYFHFLDPHDPYHSPKNYGFHDGPGRRRLIDVHALSGERQVSLRWKRSRWRGFPEPAALSAEQLDYLRSLYDEEIRFTDEHVGAVVDAFERHGMLDDTLLVITSDHGEAFMEHGLLKHGFHLYDELVHVPLILHWPNGLSASRPASLASGVDLARTLLTACGIPVPAQVKGFDLLANARGETPVPLRTYFWNQEQVGVRSRRWKVIHDRAIGRTEVYDLVADPAESDPVTDPAVQAAQFRVLEGTAERYALEAGGPRRRPAPLDDQVREHLEALGYATE